MDTFKILFTALLPFLAQVLIGPTQAQLTAQNASEGPCLSQLELLPLLYKGIDLFAILPPINYYVPMASEALYREYAEGLLGRPAATQEELDSMQLILDCGPALTTVKNTGFPHVEQPPSFAQACVPAGLPSLGDLGLLNGELNLDYVQAACIGLTATRPNGSIALPPSESFTATVDSGIWANENQTVFLIYRCPANGIKDYKVLSHSKTLDPQDIETIKEKLIPLGFSQDHVAYMNYD